MHLTHWLHNKIAVCNHVDYERNWSLVVRLNWSLIRQCPSGQYTQLISPDLNKLDGKQNRQHNSLLHHSRVLGSAILLACFILFVIFILSLIHYACTPPVGYFWMSCLKFTSCGRLFDFGQFLSVILHGWYSHITHERKKSSLWMHGF